MAVSYQDLAARLRGAYQGGAVPPLRDGLAAADGDGAYAVQAINTRHWRDAGRQIVGRKIGLTAAAVQAQLGVSQPDFGVLFDDMRVPDAGILEMGRVLQPKAEAEVALVLGRGIEGSGVSRQSLADSVDHVRVAIEIVDSRIADWRITFADTVADNGSSAAFVLGNEELPLPGLDLWSCGMVLEINGRIASVGAGAACLGHPLDAAVWLAQTLAEAGDPLRAGDIVLTGALGPMVPVGAGDEVRATIGGLGSCSFTCSRP
jgi:2-keto-4-pentenoate hydratase